MGRPAKAVSTKTGNISQDEIKKRKKIEDTLKCGEMIKPPAYLTKEQKKIFNGFVEGLKKANILGELDVSILAQTSICIDRLRTIEIQINKDLELLKKSSLMSTRNQYSKDFFRCCNELCLSPQARAKMSVSIYNNSKNDEDALIKILEGVRNEK